MDEIDEVGFLHRWQPASPTATKDDVESVRVARAIRAGPQECWFNARRAIRRLDDYSETGYVEGWAVLDGGLAIEHGWIARGEAIIDPTLPDTRAAYFPGLEFPGRGGIADFLKTPRGRRYRNSPFFYAFGWGGACSPSFRAAQESAMAYFRERVQGGSA